MEPKDWSLTLRWLHFGLASSVTLQLFLSLGVETPGEGERFAQWVFIAHELFGLVALGFALLHWAWILSGQDGGWRRLFPPDRNGWRAVRADAGALARCRLPAGGPRPGLPGLVEGLGLLVVTLQGLTGFAIFLVLPPGGRLPERLAALAEVHAGLGGLVWLYWFGHGGMALLHVLAGDATLRAIAPVRRNDAPAPRRRARAPGRKGGRGGS